MEIIHREVRAYGHALSRLIRSPYVAALGFVVLLALVWFTLPVSRRGGGAMLPPGDRPVFQEFAGGGEQGCRVLPFGVTLPRGGGVRQEVIRTASYAEAPYRLFVGDLPSGMTASLRPDVGKGSGVSRLELRASSEAPSGSYNIALLYRETQAGGVAASAVCQLNVIVP